MQPLQELTALIIQSSGCVCCVCFRRCTLFAILSIHSLTTAVLTLQDQLEISRKPAQQEPALKRTALISWRPALKVQLSQHSSKRPAVDQPNTDQLFTRRHLRKATPGWVYI